jgi:hypothetical protein
VGLERGPLSLVGTIEELLGRKFSGYGLENGDYSLRVSAALTTVCTNFAEKPRSLGRYSLLTDFGHSLCCNPPLALMHNILDIPRRDIVFLVGFKVFTAVTKKNDVFWSVAMCGSYKTDVQEECVASIFRVE